MKKAGKYALGILMSGIFIFGLHSIYLNYLLRANVEHGKSYCGDVIFLKASERQVATTVMRNSGALVVIPEEKEVFGSTELLKRCDNLDLVAYINEP